jgi:hypothetical protein
MMIPVPHASSIPLSASTSSVHRAFERLDRVDQDLLEAVLFDGCTCVDIARAIGVAPSDIRWRVGAAMLELHAAQMRDGESDHGAVATMLALRALDALDFDEAAVIDVMLEHESAQLHAYAGYCEVVGQLCLMVPAIAPAQSCVQRLLVASGPLDDDTAVN